MAIETSGKTASAAVTDGQTLLAEKTIYTKLTHSQIILPMAKELLNECGLEIADLDGVVCAKGPGSYTGLRIGVAAVKGIVMVCTQKELKCAGISTLEELAWSSAAYRGKIAAVMRARIGVVYFGIYKSDGEKVANIAADKVAGEEEFAEALRSLSAEGLLITGDCCAEMKQKYFAEAAEVKCAPFAERMQKASSLCMAFDADPARAVTVDELLPAYLQETKAEKDKAHR